MEKEILDKLKTKLEESKETIENELKKFAEKNKEIKDDWNTRYPKHSKGTGSQALEEEADKVEEYANTLPIEHSLELQLRDINLALKKIKQGKYGICEKCGKKIRIERLEVYPEARFCSECENKTE